MPEPSPHSIRARIPLRLLRWATRNPAGELHQQLVLDDLRDMGAHVVADARRQWAWREETEVAHEEALTVVATIRDGRIVRWQPFEDRAEALHAAGVDG